MPRGLLTLGSSGTMNSKRRVATSTVRTDYKISTTESASRGSAQSDNVLCVRFSQQQKSAVKRLQSDPTAAMGHL